MKELDVAQQCKPALEGRRRARHVQVLSDYFICIQIQYNSGPTLARSSRSGPGPTLALIEASSQ